MCEVSVGLADFYGKLNTAIRDAGGVAKFARLHGLNERRVYETRNAERMHAAAAYAVGLRPVTMYPVTGQRGAYVSQRQVYEKLNTFERNFPTQVEAAKQLGVSRQTLNNILNGRRGLDSVLAGLGFGGPVTRFMKTAPTKNQIAGE
ncbi:helix-turn-helix domain-containing protein [Acetobacter estunensis]|uniref:helix-turn-helix transcriptional regulator n=1 Tax=Acetobacter estunensis TaxID=104097 RepID=UPI001C2DC145|nr:helix-turn-helix domain-containing protein [Acetobacter estunensis]MBV1835637.1 helix-turn-helix domain-containing protein [Acetobacter estunensis]MBV1836102.1 helix-turn-helix domain-containing protein [Acetobacter estunensis]